MSAIEDALLQAALAGVNVTAARAELAALRAQAAELHEAHVYLDESYINDPDAEPLKLSDRIAPLIAQAAQAEALAQRVTQLDQAVAEARDALNDTEKFLGCYDISFDDLDAEVRAWLAAHPRNDRAGAPAQPEQEQAG